MAGRVGCRRCMGRREYMGGRGRHGISRRRKIGVDKGTRRVLGPANLDFSEGNVIMKIIELVIGVAFTGIFFVLVAISLSTPPGCKKRDSAEREEFSGVVLRAFLDSKHHNTKTIEYHNKSGPRQTTLFVLEEGGFSSSFNRVIV